MLCVYEGRHDMIVEADGRVRSRSVVFLSPCML